MLRDLTIQPTLLLEISHPLIVLTQLVGTELFFSISYRERSVVIYPDGLIRHVVVCPISYASYFLSGKEVFFAEVFFGFLDNAKQKNKIVEEQRRPESKKKLRGGL